MIPELGHFSLIMAFSLSVILGTLPLIGASRGITLWMNLARPVSAGIFVFMTFAFLLNYFHYLI